MESEKSGLLGRICVRSGIITRDQLADAIREHGRVGNKRRLGEILVEMGHMRPGQLKALLRKQKELSQRDGVVRPESGKVPPQDEPIRPPKDFNASSQVRKRKPSGSRKIPPRSSGMMDRILKQAIKLHASDVHVHSGQPVQLRISGKLKALKMPRLDADQTEQLAFEVLTRDDLKRFEEIGDVDIAYEIPKTGRFRGNVYRQRGAVDAVFRVIPASPIPLEQLGLPRMLARLATFHQGMVLLTGPAGCGKSSTMAALVDILNEERRSHIITVEDPIEYLHQSKRCIVNQRQVQRHTGSFASALRAALREDPDIIAIGELRDFETVSLALTAAETGHLVLATLHTNNVIRTVDRVVDVFPPRQQSQACAMLSESLRAVVSQRLVPTVVGNRLAPVTEVLVVTPAVTHLIRERKTHQLHSVLQTGRSHGMCLLDDSLAALVEANTVSRETAKRFAEDPRRFA